MNAGGPLLAVWARTEKRVPGSSMQADAPPPPSGAPIDRVGRPLTGNALLGTFAEPDIAGQLREAYNRADPPGWAVFAIEIGRNLAVYDGFDGIAGNQWLADKSMESPERYTRLAQLLADDRLSIDSHRTSCHYLAVERTTFGEPNADCGGRTPGEDVNGVFRSLLIRGTSDTSDDGVDHDDRTPSSTDFPFLAAPSTHASFPLSPPSCSPSAPRRTRGPRPPTARSR